MGFNIEKVKQIINEYKENEIENKYIKLNFKINEKPENYVRERAGRGKHFYNPKEHIIEKYRNLMIHQMSKNEYKKTREYLNEDHQIELQIKYYIPIQKASSNKEAALKELGIIRPIKRPDLDNYDKLILDALHNVIYNDDASVIKIESEKFYSLNPRTEIIAIIK